MVTNFNIETQIESKELSILTSMKPKLRQILFVISLNLCGPFPPKRALNHLNRK